MAPIFKSTYKPPSRLFTPEGFRKVLRESFKEAGQSVTDQLAKTTSTWKEPPTFDVRVSGNTLEITTAHKIFNILNEGAPPHDIKPKRKKRLAFQWAGRGSYQPKSKPGSLRSYVGMAGTKVRAGPLVRPFMVRHPGIKARRWDIPLADRFDEKVASSVARKVDKLFR